MAKPIVVTRAGTTAISDGEVIAVLRHHDLRVQCGVVTPPTDANAILLSLEDGPETVSLLEMTEAFRPLVSGGHGTLSRLTLNVANACNLWCSYCYADHGQYHKPRSFMAADIAVSIVRNVASLYSAVEVVHFFGGEPLMNPDAIEAVCRFFVEHTAVPPKFVATTNGTVLSPRVRRLIRDYEIGLTISIDGPRDVHDANRPMQRGASSFDVIARNLEILRAMDRPFDVECTYTVTHHEAGITVSDLLEFFGREFDQAVAHIAWAHLPRPKSREKQQVFRGEKDFFERQHMPSTIVEALWRDGAKTSMRNIASNAGCSLSFVTGMLAQLAAGQPASAYCPAFTSQLSIATDGSVYPCFMFIGDPSMRVGNVIDGTGLSRDRARELWDRYRLGMHGTVTGTSAWYAGLAGGCVAGEYIATGQFTERVYESTYAAIAEEVLLGLARGAASHRLPIVA